MRKWSIRTTKIIPAMGYFDKKGKIIITRENETVDVQYEKLKEMIKYQTDILYYLEAKLKDIPVGLYRLHKRVLIEQWERTEDDNK